MNILVALRQEEKRLEDQLGAVQRAIAALNGRPGSRVRVRSAYRQSSTTRRTLSAAARAKISRAAKERWARVRAEKAKRAK